MSTQRALAVSALLLATACGEGVANIRAVGDGNEALVVRARADFDGNNTNWQIEVFRDGVQLDDTNAVVEIGEGEEGALFASEFQGNAFRNDFEGYAQTFQLVVTAGEDNVEAVFTGPSPVQINAPAAGTVVDLALAEDLDVEWDSAEGDNADIVRVSMRGFSTTLVGDPGNLTIPFVNIDPEADEVQIERSNFAILDGGAPGSQIEISERSDVGISVTF